MRKHYHYEVINSNDTWFISNDLLYIGFIKSVPDIIFNFVQIDQNWVLD